MKIFWNKEQKVSLSGFMKKIDSIEHNITGRNKVYKVIWQEQDLETVRKVLLSCQNQQATLLIKSKAWEIIWNLMISIHGDVLQCLQKLAVKCWRTQIISGLRLDSKFKKVKIYPSLFSNWYQCYSITQKNLYNKWCEQTR